MTAVADMVAEDGVVKVDVVTAPAGNLACVCLGLGFARRVGANAKAADQPNRKSSA
jgi:hypothetical protein